MGSSEDGVVTLLAGWLLAHELADEWIRDAVARGRGQDADPVAVLAARIDERKERLRETLSQEVGDAEAPSRIAELGEALAALDRRLESMEARLDGLARGAGATEGSRT